MDLACRSNWRQFNEIHTTLANVVFSVLAGPDGFNTQRLALDSGGGASTESEVAFLVLQQLEPILILEPIQIGFSVKPTP